MRALIDRPGFVLEQPGRLHGGLPAPGAPGSGVALGLLELVAELEHGVAEQRDGIASWGGAGPWRRIALSARRASTRVLRTA